MQDLHESTSWVILIRNIVVLEIHLGFIFFLNVYILKQSITIQTLQIYVLENEKSW